MEIELSSIIGFIASAVLLSSFMLADIRKLRLVNSLGCLLFMAYGFLLEDTAWSVVITNFCIILINFYYLFIKRQN